MVLASERTAEGKFAPGKSGNPGGKRRSLVELIELARAETPEAIATLAKIMRDKQAAAAARITAACALLDRGWGKPKEYVTLEGDLALHVIGIDRPPEITETREEWLARRKAELAALLPPANDEAA